MTGIFYKIDRTSKLIADVNNLIAQLHKQSNNPNVKDDFKLVCQPTDILKTKAKATPKPKPTPILEIKQEEPQHIMSFINKAEQPYQLLNISINEQTGTKTGFQSMQQELEKQQF